MRLKQHKYGCTLSKSETRIYKEITWKCGQYKGKWFHPCNIFPDSEKDQKILIEMIQNGILDDTLFEIRSCNYFRIPKSLVTEEDFAVISY
jgi:hypothetical protein